MVVRTGKYLRVIGYDAEWISGVRTHELIRRANAEGRVFVTRNRRLPDQYPRPDRVLTLIETDPVEQFYTIVKAYDLHPLERLFSKCIRCNVALTPVIDKTVIRDRVHPNVYARFDRFYTCPSCGTVFWKGSHVRNTCAKLRLPLPADGGVP
jgi:uncharacterized protein with PIN domain